VLNRQAKRSLVHELRVEVCNKATVSPRCDRKFSWPVELLSFSSTTAIRCAQQQTQSTDVEDIKPHGSLSRRAKDSGRVILAARKCSSRKETTRC